MTTRELDIVLFGATGFVGRLTAGHLATHAPAGTRIGLAGRDETKLRRLRDSLGEPASGWETVVADVDRSETVRQMAERATVVATTVGPYARYGMPLVAGCAAAGTHYADLTGEVSFVRKVIDDHHDDAVRTGARIVNACGFDAIPSDIGVFELHRAAEAAGAGALRDTTLVVAQLRGGVSGGTLPRCPTCSPTCGPTRRCAAWCSIPTTSARTARPSPTAPSRTGRPSGIRPASTATRIPAVGSRRS